MNQDHSTHGDVKFNRADTTNCSDYGGTVVVIDVIRAFTTAAVAFSHGAREIILVSEVAEAIALRTHDPTLKIMGEVNGVKPPEFDFSNSPAELDQQNLAGCTLVQRTTAGTLGMARSTAANILLAGSLVCATATTRYLRRLDSSEITFVITGKLLDLDGDEDAACADCLEVMLQEMQPDHAAIRQRVLSSTWGRRFGDPRFPHLPTADIDYFLDIDRFDFAMRATRAENRLVLNSIPD